MTTLLKIYFILLLSFLRHPNNKTSPEPWQLRINSKTGPKSLWGQRNKNKYYLANWPFAPKPECVPTNNSISFPKSLGRKPVMTLWNSISNRNLICKSRFPMGKINFIDLLEGVSCLSTLLFPCKHVRAENRMLEMGGCQVANQEIKSSWHQER